MARFTDNVPPALDKPQHYVERGYDSDDWKEENPYFTVYERIIAGEAGIAIAEFRRAVDAYNYKEALSR